MKDSSCPAELVRARKRYGAVTALDDVSLAVNPGEILAIVGPNGAGKTTAIRLLLGLTTPTSGEARLFGLSPRDRSAQMRTGVMLQTSGVPATLRVSEHIELFSSYYPDPLPIAEILAAAGLRGLERRKAGELSGGQRQRLLFALAICGRPELLFLDEPTVGLDPESRRAFWRQIRQMTVGGSAVILTTHYLEEADALANRVLLLDRGRILAEGTPAEIKSRAGQKSLEDAFLELTNSQEVWS